MAAHQKSGFCGVVGCFLVCSSMNFSLQPKLFGTGSYVDTIDGSANHLLRVSTRMENSADSGGHNTGFRCARTIQKTKKKKQKKHKTQRRRTDL